MKSSTITPRKSTITPREKEVAEYIKIGLNNTEIGEILGVSRHTIKAHTILLLQKWTQKQNSFGLHNTQCRK